MNRFNIFWCNHLYHDIISDFSQKKQNDVLLLLNFHGIVGLFICLEMAEKTTCFLSGFYICLSVSSIQVSVGINTITLCGSSVIEVKGPTWLIPSKSHTTKGRFTNLLAFPNTFICVNWVPATPISPQRIKVSFIALQGNAISWHFTSPGQCSKSSKRHMYMKN